MKRPWESAWPGLGKHCRSVPSVPAKFPCAPCNLLQAPKNRRRYSVSLAPVELVRLRAGDRGMALVLTTSVLDPFLLLKRPGRNAGFLNSSVLEDLRPA